jgi:hypothetical protein
MSYTLSFEERHGRPGFREFRPPRRYFDLHLACAAARKEVKASDPDLMLEAIVRDSGDRIKLRCWLDAEGKYQEPPLV